MFSNQELTNTPYRNRTLYKELKSPIGFVLQNLNIDNGKMSKKSENISKSEAHIVISYIISTNRFESLTNFRQLDSITYAHQIIYDL